MSGAALDITWCVQVDANATQMSAFAARIQASSDALWTATHGQLYLRNVTLVDKSVSGHVILDNLSNPSAQGAFGYTYQISGGAWEIHMGGAYPMQVWIHEMGHAEVLEDWTLPEEYTLSAGLLPCTMGAYLMGSGEGQVTFCDSANCQTSRAGCWENVILQTHPSWTYPNSLGSPPASTITIQDN
jgi:hypothetical protein